MITSLIYQKVTITGGLRKYTRRKAAQKILMEGGIFSAKITKDTDILIVADELIRGDMVRETEKIRKSDEWCIDWLSESDFYDLVG